MEVKKAAFVTYASIFIMGFINAFSMKLGPVGSAVTPQTGNVINIGINLANKNWEGLQINLMLFVGFIIGVIFSLLFVNALKNRTVQHVINWTIFALPIAFYPFYMQFLTKPIACLVLGIASGAGLGFFRKIFHIDINNAMATGNVRFLGVWFAEAFIKRSRTEKKEVFTFVIFLLAVFFFAFGAFLCIGLSNIEKNMTFPLMKIVFIILCVIPYFFAPKKAA